MRNEVEANNFFVCFGRLRLSKPLDRTLIRYFITMSCIICTKYRLGVFMPKNWPFYNINIVILLKLDGIQIIGSNLAMTY
jgi:hypothetical protein